MGRSQAGDAEKWREYWQDPEVKHYYFLGKDNIPFHTIIWPAMLLGYGGLNLPYDVPANEFLTFKGEKFSKSRGVGIDVPSILKGFDSDLVRFYLAANVPEGKDATSPGRTSTPASTTSWSPLWATITTGCLASPSRTTVWCRTCTWKDTEREREEVFSAILSAKNEVDNYLGACEFKKALKGIMDLAQFGNQFFDKVAP